MKKLKSMKKGTHERNRGEDINDYRFLAK